VITCRGSLDVPAEIAYQVARRPTAYRGAHDARPWQRAAAPFVQAVPPENTHCPRCIRPPPWGLPTLTDKGYTGAGIGIMVPRSTRPTAPPTRHPVRNLNMSLCPEQIQFRAPLFRRNPVAADPVAQYGPGARAQYPSIHDSARGEYQW